MDLLGPMITSLFAVFGASLLGSPHCAGMCGPLLTFLRGKDDTASSLHAQATYHLARGTAYASLGALAGGLGQAANLGGAWAGIGSVSAWIGGSFLILWAAVRIWPRRWGRFRPPRFLHRTVARIGRLGGTRAWTRSLALGFASALLPCGWLFAFVAVAGGSGDWLHGAAIMVAFWAGTVPVLFGLGLGLQTVFSKITARRPVLTTLVLTSLGLWVIIARADIDLAGAVHRQEERAVTEAPVDPETGAQPVNSNAVLPDSKSSCCHGD